MAHAKMTSKGQITVPVSVRRRLQLVPGTRVDFEEQPNGDYVLRRRTIDARELKGVLPKPARAITVEDMKRGAAAAIAERRLAGDR